MHASRKPASWQRCYNARFRTVTLPVVPPTAYARLPANPQMSISGSVVPLASAAHAVPSKCRTVPTLPTTNTLHELEPHTPFSTARVPLVIGLHAVPL